MILTEEQAKERWCPHVRLIPSDVDGMSPAGAPCGYNRAAHKERTVTTISSAKCIGSACMSWRWEFPYFVPETKGGQFPDDCIESVQRGYCGLAGKQ